MDWFLNGKSAGNHSSCPLLCPMTYIYIHIYVLICINIRVSCKCSLQPIHWTKAIGCWFQRWDSFWWIRWISRPKMCVFTHGKHWTHVLVYFKCGLTTVTTGPCKYGLHNSFMHKIMNKLCTFYVCTHSYHVREVSRLLAETPNPSMVVAVVKIIGRTDQGWWKPLGPSEDPKFSCHKHRTKSRREKSHHPHGTAAYSGDTKKSHQGVESHIRKEKSPWHSLFHL